MCKQWKYEYYLQTQTLLVLVTAENVFYMDCNVQTSKFF